MYTGSNSFNPPDSKGAERFELAKGFTVADYRACELAGDRPAIARLIRRRFSERYLEPLASIPRENKSGFLTMAICCLMIEALQSFREGREHNKARGASQDCFERFFSDTPSFSLSPEAARDFYKHIRCGILHQAETLDGWRILRKGSLAVDLETKTINANLFVKALADSLDHYCAILEQSSWTSPLWQNARKKLEAICRNCVAGSAAG
jgi:hypothetical protein